MGMPLKRMMASITTAATTKRAVISAPTETPPLRVKRVMGKPSPHTAATKAMMTTAVPWEMLNGLGAVARHEALGMWPNTHPTATHCLRQLRRVARWIG